MHVHAVHASVACVPYLCKIVLDRFVIVSLLNAKIEVLKEIVHDEPGGVGGSGGDVGGCGGGDGFIHARLQIVHDAPRVVVTYLRH